MPDQPRPLRLGLCCSCGGIFTTQRQPNAAKFNGHTTYGDDFTSKELPRQEPIPVREAPASPAFEGASTYDTDFNQKPLPQREQAAPQQWHPSPGKFSATTEYGSQFQGWALPHHKPGLGIAMVDGSFYPLINPGWEPPTQASVVVTSVVDDQARAYADEEEKCKDKDEDSAANR